MSDVEMKSKDEMKINKIKMKKKNEIQFLFKKKLQNDVKGMINQQKNV